MSQRLLITCFEPFAGRSTNTSMRLLGPAIESPPDGVVTRMLPVDFKALRRIVPRITRTMRPECWLLLGEDGSGERMRCERLAVNVLDGEIADNQGMLPRGRAVRGGPSAYFATMDPAGLVRHFEERQIPAYLSDDAGTYACNLALYLALHHSKRHGAPREVGFIHVPRAYRRTGHSLQHLRKALMDLAEALASSGSHAA